MMFTGCLGRRRLQWQPSVLAKSTADAQAVTKLVPARRNVSNCPFHVRLGRSVSPVQISGVEVP